MIPPVWEETVVRCSKGRGCSCRKLFQRTRLLLYGYEKDVVVRWRRTNM